MIMFSRSIEWMVVVDRESRENREEGLREGREGLNRFGSRNDRAFPALCIPIINPIQKFCVTPSSHV